MTFIGRSIFIEGSVVVWLDLEHSKWQEMKNRITRGIHSKLEPLSHFKIKSENNTITGFISGHCRNAWMHGGSVWIYYEIGQHKPWRQPQVSRIQIVEGDNQPSSVCSTYFLLRTMNKINILWLIENRNNGSGYLWVLRDDGDWVDGWQCFSIIYDLTEIKMRSSRLHLSSNNIFPSLAHGTSTTSRLGRQCCVDHNDNMEISWLGLGQVCSSPSARYKR